MPLREIIAIFIRIQNIIPLFLSYLLQSFEMAGAGPLVYAVLPGAVNTKLNWDLDLGMDPSELLAPEYVDKRIFRLAGGGRVSKAHPYFFFRTGSE